MKLQALIALSTLLLVASGTAAAQTGKQPWEEYDKLINTRKAIATLGPQMFGDSVDLSTGALSFSTTDVSLTGNNALPVAVTRTFVVRDDEGRGSDNAFGDWDIDIPNISGLFSTTWHDNRCDQAVPPSVLVTGQTPHPWADSVAGPLYWKGNSASMPGGGELLRLDAASARPATGGPYVWITPGRTVFSCLATIKNGTGQGFLAVTADGTKYWFDNLAQNQDSKYSYTVEIAHYVGENALYGTAEITRKKNTLYATRVEDRFGNWVTYTYSNAYNQPIKVSAITSSDGRSITFHYNGNVIDSVTSGSRSWSYQYTGSYLTAVVQPDGGRWAIAFSALSTADIEYLSGAPDPNWRTCFREGPLDTLYSGPYTGTITHPSGAVGTFTVAPVVHGRSNVPAICQNFVSSTNSYDNYYNDPTNDSAIFPIKWHSFSLTSKTISGPGLATQSWSFSYTAGTSWFYPDPQYPSEPLCGTLTCGDPVCLSDTCAGVATTTITGPGDWKRYTFGNSYRYNEGKLLKIEEGADAATILRTTDKTYELAQSGQPYTTKIGSSQHPYTDGFTSEYPRPEVSSVISQQDVTFSRTVDTGCLVPSTAYCLDSFLRPTRVKKFSSLGDTKTEVTTYSDNLSKWVLGQVATVTNTTPNVVMSKTDYDATTALPIRNYGPGTTATPGKLQNTLTYNTDGTLATVKDGNNNTTTLSSWKRGVPQLITHADAKTESAVVDNNGWISSVNDENNYKTCYTYDLMGRLASLTYTSEAAANTCNTTTWATTTQTFAPVTTTEYGIPTGHWKQTVSTGNARKITYFDAMWRPLVAEQYDTSNITGTRSIAVTRYDVGGHPVYQSLPLASLTDYATVTQGIRSTYDAIDRVTQVDQDSELGVLSTKTKYLTGFMTEVTNPRGFVTTQLFQVFDTPSTDLPVGIAAPQQVSTVIARDVFGKPTQVTRYGPGN